MGYRRNKPANSTTKAKNCVSVGSRAGEVFSSTNVYSCTRRLIYAPVPPNLPTVTPTDPNVPNSTSLTGKIKNKLFIIGDSHARSLGGLVASILSYSYDTFTLCKPSNKFNQVIEDIDRFADGFGTNDFVLILGGSNDIRQHTKTIWNSTIKSKLSSLASKTVIFSALPIRHGMTAIKWTNESIR